MKASIVFLVILLTFVPHARAQETPTSGPIAELTKRIASLEAKIANLQLAAPRRAVVDSRGRLVGYVFAETLTTATIDIPFRGSTKKLVVSTEGATEGPGYSAQLFTSNDCTGPAYARASRFDGTLYSGYWGDNFLWRNLRTGIFEYPRAGAVPSFVTLLSFSTPTGRCIQFTETVSAFLESDLEPIDPLAAFTPPYKIIR